MTDEQIEELVRVVVNVATAKGEPEYGGGTVCECYYTMGRVRHICIHCQAREALEKCGIEVET